MNSKSILKFVKLPVMFKKVKNKACEVYKFCIFLKTPDEFSVFNTKMLYTKLHNLTFTNIIFFTCFNISQHFSTFHNFRMLFNTILLYLIRK